MCIRDSVGDRETVYGKEEIGIPPNLCVEVEERLKHNTSCLDYGGVITLLVRVFIT